MIGDNDRTLRGTKTAGITVSGAETSGSHHRGDDTDDHEPGGRNEGVSLTHADIAAICHAVAETRGEHGSMDPELMRQLQQVQETMELLQAQVATMGETQEDLRRDTSELQRAAGTAREYRPEDYSQGAEPPKDHRSPRAKKEARS